MSDPVDLEGLERLLEAATPRPWVPGTWSGMCHIRHPEGIHGQGRCRYEPSLWDGPGIATETPDTQVVGTHYDELALSDADRALIVAAVNALPALLVEVRALRRALEPFASGMEWGTLKAWLVAGAEAACGDRAAGVAAAKRLTEWQVAADSALAPRPDVAASSTPHPEDHP